MTNLALSATAAADRCSVLRRQQERIDDEATELEVDHPLFTTALEQCARESKDDGTFAACALLVCAIGGDTCGEVAARVFDIAVRKAKVAQMARQAGCAQASSPSGRPTAIEFMNSCGHPVQIAVGFQNAAGRWDAQGWWSFRSGERGTLRLESGDVVSTYNAHLYYYAIATDASGWEWSGTARMSVDGRPLAMKEAGAGPVNLTCEGE